MRIMRCDGKVACGEGQDVDFSEGSDLLKRIEKVRWPLIWKDSCFENYAQFSLELPFGPFLSLFVHYNQH